MFSWYKKIKNNEQTRLKYENLQYFLSKIIKLENTSDVHEIAMEIHTDNIMDYKTKKKLRSLYREKINLLRLKRRQ